jgi:hypothetical protein
MLATHQQEPEELQQQGVMAVPRTAQVDVQTLTAGTLSRPRGISTSEAQRFQAPRCERCGALTQLRWIDVSATPDSEPRWQLDRIRCLTPGCSANADNTANGRGSADRR